MPCTASRRAACCASTRAGAAETAPLPQLAEGRCARPESCRSPARSCGSRTWGARFAWWPKAGARPSTMDRWARRSQPTAGSRGPGWRLEISANTTPSGPSPSRPAIAACASWSTLPTPRVSPCCEQLNLLELQEGRPPDPLSPEGIDLLVRIKKVAFRDRDQHNTDPERMRVPVSRLISKEHARELLPLVLGLAQSPTRPAGAAGRGYRPTSAWSTRKATRCP